MCGEKQIINGTFHAGQGSPPRVRGKVAPGVFNNEKIGITPAHAGKSLLLQDLPLRWEDHPRACGEKGCPYHRHHPQLGSPPRMRGKVCDHALKCVRNRITPAHAGKRAGVRTSGRASKDHPRACGEKKSKRTGTPLPTGSPPRMRGKEKNAGCTRPTSGITPAHAGKSVSQPLKLKSTGDHPRACGEKPIMLSWAVWDSGSPPRMRGKGNFRILFSLSGGITPAHAGKSRWYP